MIFPSAGERFWSRPCRRKRRTASCADELAGQVDVDDLAPVIKAQLRKGGVALDARVRDKNVDPAELLISRLEKLSAALRRRDVGLNGFGAATVLADLADNVPGRVLARPIIDNDRSPCCCKGPCNALADAGAGARDDRPAVLELRLWHAILHQGSYLGLFSQTSGADANRPSC